jgi:hypothetical protein
LAAHRRRAARQGRLALRSGKIGTKVERTGKLFARNLWLEKLSQ